MTVGSLPRPGDVAPVCPVWCLRELDHDVPDRTPRPGELIRRHHVGQLVGDDRIGDIRLEQVDDVLVGGPAVSGPPVIVLDSIEHTMSVPRFRALAAELSRVVGFLAELILDDPIGESER